MNLRSKLLAVAGTLLVSPLAIASAPLIADGPNPAAPAELQQFGQLAGDWACTGQNLQQDGSWKKSPGIAHWSWYYVLDGFAIQDVWQPAPNAGPGAAMGTNLRIYDAENSLWRMVWTTSKQGYFDTFRSSFRNKEILMYGERPKSAFAQAHLSRITFHNIGEKHFDWKYESSGLADGRQWREVARLSCDRSEDQGS